MRVFYFLIFFLLLGGFMYSQGNLPLDYMAIEYDGTIYHDGDTVNICGQTPGEEYAFNAEYLPVGIDNNEYQIESIPFTTIYPLIMENWLFPDNNNNGLLDPGEVTDDTFSSTFNLPFTFCYFGNEFSALKVGTNGRITFDLGVTSDAWSFEPDDTLPTNYFTGNTIFGVYQDTNPADGDMDFDPDDGDGVSNITYGIFGEAPFRAFVVSYTQMPFYGGSCNSMNAEEPLMQTYQIILHEGTNIIDVIVWERTSCPGWNDGLGIIGIQNGDGTIAYVPPGRNTGTWEASQEAWRFTPSGGGIGTANTITWEVGDEYGGSDTTLVTALPESDTITLINKYYLSCSNDFAIASIDLFINVVNISLEEEGDIYSCDGSPITLHAQQQEYETYNWYKDGILIDGENGPTLTVTESGNYYIEYSDVECTVISNSVNVFIEDTIELNDYTEVLCDENQPGSELVDLNSYIDQMISNAGSSIITWYPTLLDAENQSNPIPNAGAYTLTTGMNTFYVRIDINEVCSAIGVLTLDLQPAVSLNPVVVGECYADDLVYDLTSFNTDISTDTGLSFSYFNSLEDAQNNTNAIPESTATALSVAGTTTIYVRAENAESCFSITTIMINVYGNPYVTPYVDDLNVAIGAENGTEPYEYSLDGTNWTTSNGFTDLEPGDYLAYVRTSNGCIGTAPFTIELQELDFVPSIITPNGDGVNDTWVINGIQYFPGSVVKLYDRYGKLILDKTTTDNPEVWDAKYLNEHVQSTTYWYTINLSDGKTFQGYLVVRNRNSKSQL